MVKHPTEAVEEVTDTRDGDKGTQQPGDIARRVRQVANDEQVEAEQDETAVPDIGEGVDPQERQGVQLTSDENGQVTGATEQVEHSDELADGNEEDPCVGDARLMKLAGTAGVRRGRALATTRRDPGADRAPDLVKRHFVAERPNALWVTDLTYVATWAGMAYVCSIVDAFSRMIVGWRAATNMRTEMVLDALEMARWQRGTHLQGLITHSDAGSQFTSVRYGERLTELGALPSIGSTGDSFDNALAETVNGLYKTELVRGPKQGPWRTVDDLELAALSWVHWYNTERLHGYLGDVPPAEFEAAYAVQQTDQTLVGIQ